MKNRSLIKWSVVSVLVFGLAFAASWQVLGHPDLLVAAGLLVVQAVAVGWYLRSVRMRDAKKL